MDFLSTGNFGSKAERQVWHAFKTAFEQAERGNCWHNHPITTVNSNPVLPDIVMFHSQWGLNIIEVKGCKINEIEAIEGNIWYMVGYNEDTITPLEQARGHMFSIRDRLKGFNHSILLDDNGELKVTTNYFVALPYITENEWLERFPDHPNVDRNKLILSTDLDSQSLRVRFVTSSRKQKQLSDDEWNSVIACVAGSDALSKKPMRPAKSPSSRYAMIRKIEEQMKKLDDAQHRIGIQIPAGPQRIRGLAGTGKTVVLAQKAAHMHLQNPDWTIAYTFYTRSLYAQVRELITRFVRSLSGGAIEEPNWDKLRVLHSWGGKYLPGFYYDMCDRLGADFRNFGEAREYFFAPKNQLFELCCAELLDYEILPFYDAIIIDEAQDIGPSYAQLCYHTLNEPKRVVWAYDEVQSLDRLEIPTPEELFGYNDDGTPRVTLDGPPYNDEVERDETLGICYRNPRPILLSAHAFGLGLRRRGSGAIQFISRVRGWNDIGYEIEADRGKALTAGNTLVPGTKLILHRPKKYSPHYLEDEVGYHGLVTHKTFANREEELQWIAEDIAKNIQSEEIRPHDIAVLTLDTRDSNVFEREYILLKEHLFKHKINTIFLTPKGETDLFRKDNHVTVSGTYRAKGNEAWLIYVYGFENADNPEDDNSVPITRRNIAFTAMTRSRGWLTLTGVGNRSQTLFREIDEILEEVGRVHFTVPDMSKLERLLQSSREREERVVVKKAEDATRRAFEALAEVDPDKLPDELKEMLKKLGRRFSD